MAVTTSKELGTGVLHRGGGDRGGTGVTRPGAEFAALVLDIAQELQELGSQHCGRGRDEDRVRPGTCRLIPKSLVYWRA